MVLFPAPPTPTVTILMLSELSASDEDLSACGVFSPTTDLTKSSIFSPFIILVAFPQLLRVVIGCSGDLNRF
jgi:hypothetical protein